MKNKVLTAVLSLVAAGLVLIGCSRYTHCGFCSGYESGNSNGVYGKTLSLCDTCSNDFNVFRS